MKAEESAFYKPLLAKRKAREDAMEGDRRASCDRNRPERTAEDAEE